MDELIEFVNDIIDSFESEAEENIYERSVDTQKDLKELEKTCEQWKNEFKVKLDKLTKK